MNLAIFLFLIGVLGFILNRKNIILMIIAIEIMLLAVTLLLLISSFNFDDNSGQVFSIYIIAIAGAESVIGLSILVAYYRSLVVSVAVRTHKLFSSIVDSLNIPEWGRHLPLRGGRDTKKIHTNFNKIQKRCYASWAGKPNEERKKAYIYPKDVTIDVRSITLTKIIPNTICTAIVIWNQFHYCSIGLRLTPANLSLIALTQVQSEILIGILLGDGNIRKPSKNGNPQVQFKQGFTHLVYVLYLFSYLSSICSHFPTLVRTRDPRRGLSITLH